MASPAPAPSSAHHTNVVPSEVGWQFVPQYYTYMNKQPNRLHCFYTKNSTFIHGTEGEDVKPCFGQQEIHNKILSIGFNDCKVFINSVDAQSSANGGIIIQVIGEMSNNGEAWRKFAQTFFLAEQPNGYFVLNDIFRYLKEETVESEETDGGEVAIPAEPEVVVTFSAAPPDVETAVEPVIEEPVTIPPAVIETESAQPKVNGISHTESAPGAAQPEPEPEEPAKPEPVREPTPLPEEPAPVEIPEPPEEPAQPAPAVAAPAPAVASAPVAAPSSQPAPVAAPASAPAQPQAPPAPKTWANLAAANSNKWGNAVAQEAKGVSASAVPAVSPLPSGATTPSRDGRTTPARVAKGDRDTQSPAYAAAMGVTTAQCFVKGVTEVVSHQSLTGTLTTRFGPIKEVEIVRSKACAFIEFTNVDSAKRAIAASLPQNQGGEGGIRIDVGEAGQARIVVETRKERADRPPPRQRPNPTGTGEQRGTFRNRGGAGGGRGRGTAPVASTNQK